MSEEAAFLAAIRAAPSDDTLRLVYADWLDERGRPESSFLRLECELAALDATDPRRGALWAAFCEARNSFDLKWLAAISRVLPDLPFDEDTDWGYVGHSIFEGWLRLANEPSLFSADPCEQYRFMTSTGAPGDLLRIEADNGEAVVKAVHHGPDGWTVEEHRRSLSARELARFRQFVERAEFWTLPAPRPRFNSGLDGAHYLFEARVGKRYHFVHRWSPHRDSFARLCDHCHALRRSVVAPSRPWWQFWS